MQEGKKEKHTVFGAVTDLDSLVNVLELLDGDDGAEDLFLGNLHVTSNVGEQSGLDEVALVTVALTTLSDGGTLLLAALDVVHDTLELELRDLGTLEGVDGEGVTELVLGGTLLEASDEFVVDLLVDQDTRTGAAALAVVEEDTKVGPRDSVVNVGIVEDNVGRLATQLESDLLQVTLGSGLQDHTANDGRTSEGNLVDVHVVGDGVTGHTTETRDDVDNTGGEASLLNEFTHVQTRERGLLSSFQDNGVTGRDGRTNLPCPHENREVPGNDLTANTNGLVAGVGESLGVGVDGLTVDLVGPASVVADTANSHTQVNLGHGEGLAVVQGLNGGELLNVPLDQVSQLVQQLTPVRGGDTAPFALERGTGRSNSSVDILLSGLVDGSDNSLVGGVDSLEGLAFGTLDVLVVNEPIEYKQSVACPLLNKTQVRIGVARTGPRAAQQ